MPDFTKKAWDNIEAYNRKVIKPIFPSASLKETGFSSSPNCQIHRFNAHLSARNLFERTIYEYTGDGLFLHFTSLPKLSAILKTGFIRMSDFNCLTDKSEIIFASHHFKKDRSNEEQESKKDKMFCLSACESKQQVLLDAHMWKHYADQGHGCAIEYKFTTGSMANMSLGRILYGKRKMKPLKDLDALMQNFALSNNDFKIVDPIGFLTPIFAFHKDIKFQKENEVRLFFYQDGSIFNTKPHLNQYADFYKRDEVRKFIKIFLRGKNPYLPIPDLDNDLVLGISPQIEITRVILGPNIKNTLDVIELIIKLKEQEKQNFEIWRINDKLVCTKFNVC